MTETVPPAQSSSSTSVTACGWRPSTAGYTAVATAAASWTGSFPATRVVFLVARTGNPRTFLGFSPFTLTSIAFSPPPQAASTRAAKRALRNPCKGRMEEGTIAAPAGARSRIRAAFRPSLRVQFSLVD